MNKSHGPVALCKVLEQDYNIFAAWQWKKTGGLRRVVEVPVSEGVLWPKKMKIGILRERDVNKGRKSVWLRSFFVQECLSVQGSLRTKMPMFPDYSWMVSLSRELGCGMEMWRCLYQEVGTCKQGDRTCQDGHQGCSQRPESVGHLVTDKELSVSQDWRSSQCSLACTCLARGTRDSYF